MVLGDKKGTSREQEGTKLDVKVFFSFGTIISLRMDNRAKKEQAMQKRNKL